MLDLSRTFVRCLFALLLAVPVVGCDMTRTLDLDDRNHESRLVLQGQFRPAGPWTVRVSRSVGAFESGRVGDEQFSVTDATVAVFQNDEKLGTLTRDTLNRYSTDAFAPEPETDYRVRASAPELEPVEATDRVPSLPPTRLSLERDSTEDDPRRTLRLTIEDPGGVQNDYRIVLASLAEQDSGSTIRSRQFFRTQNRAILNEMGESFDVEGENTYSGSHAVFTDALFDGQTYTIDLEVQSRVRGPRDGSVRVRAYELQVQALSADTYTYLHTRRLAAETGNNPFASPVDAEGNVEGGYGLMGGINVDTLREVVDPATRAAQ